jgi:hypothetical protein
MLKVEATFDYFARAAKHVDTAAGVWQETSQTESTYLKTTLPQLTTKANTVLDNSNQLVLSLKSTSDKLGTATDVLTSSSQKTLASVTDLVTSTNKNLQPVFLSSTAAIDQAKFTLKGVDDLVTDPAIKKSLVNIQDTTASLADGTKQGDQILKDGRVVADKYVAPQKMIVRISGYALKAGQLLYDFIR